MSDRIDAQSDASPRYHGLDGLRASMMLLGIVLHATLSYGRNDYGAGWPFQDADTHPAFDVAFTFIHSFRMPVFFVMAGFFAALIHDRRSGWGLLRNRAMRVLLPLVVGWPLLFPAYKTGFVFAATAQESSFSQGLAAVGAYLTDRSLLDGPRPMHLWFLIYLLYFYVFAWMLAEAVRLVPRSWRTAAKDGFTYMLRSRGSVVWFAAAMAAVLVLTSTRTSVTPSYDFLPHLDALLLYGAFFGFGWLLHGSREYLSVLQRNAWALTLLGVFLFGCQYIGVRRVLFFTTGYTLFAPILETVNSVLLIWLLLYGTTGLFLRHLQHPDARWRYLADASYWLYLIHLPLTIWLPGWLSRFGWPAALKFLIVVGLTTAIGLVTYELLVRRTFLRRILGGQSGSPKRETHAPDLTPETATQRTYGGART